MSSRTSQNDLSGVDNYSCCSRDRSNNRRRRHSNQGDTLLKANTGVFGPTTIPITAPLLQTAVNQPIASVTVGTDGLEDPSTLVQFLGTLTASALAAVGVTYNFTLFRNCKGMAAREQLRSFTVSQAVAGVAGIPDSRGLSFAFFQGESDCFEHECCTYTLELTSITATVAVLLTVTINGTLSVLVVGETEED